MASEARGAMSIWMDWLKLTLTQGGPGQCIFPINNACNAGCAFCGFNRDALKRADWKFVPVEGARRAAEILYRNGIHYLVLTGGEPMMHPNFREICRHAKEAGMTVLLVTNGSLLTPQSCEELKKNGVSSVFISIDAHDVRAHEKNRGLPKVCERIRAANAGFKELGVQSTASVTMSRLIEDYSRLPLFLKTLGFESVTFSYPLTHLDSSFLGFADSGLVSFKPEELAACFDAVLGLRQQFHVVNPVASLEDMKRFLRGQPQLFDCLGGYKYFYLDWDLKLWRCHHWEKPIGSILDMERIPTVRDGCQRCMIDCMRDPSVLQHAAVSLGDALGHLRCGSPVKAASALLTRKNRTSVRSALEQASWIAGL